MAFYKRLAMGGADSMFLLMALLMAIVKRVTKLTPALSTFKIVNLRSVRLGCTGFSLAGEIVMLHVNDTIVGHVHQRLADFAVVCIANAFEAVEFVVTTEVGGILKKILGVTQ